MVRGMRYYFVPLGKLGRNAELRRRRRCDSSPSHLRLIARRIANRVSHGPFLILMGEGGGRRGGGASDSYSSSTGLRNTGP